MTSNLIPPGQIQISGPEFEVGEMVIPISDYHKSRDLDKQIKVIYEAGGAQILAVETAKRFPQYPPNNEYVRMLHFADNMRMAADLFRRVD